jgi:hypothetical protein
MAVPDKGFKLTTEILRRKPDSALVWYEDFRDPITLQSTYWTTLSGNWAVWRSDEYATGRVYSQLEGSGQLAGDMTVYRMFIFELGLLSLIMEAGVLGYLSVTSSVVSTLTRSKWNSIKDLFCSAVMVQLTLKHPPPIYAQTPICISSK